MAAGAVYLAAPRDGEDPPTPTEWDAQAQRAFAPLVDRTPGLVTGARGWMTGEKTAEEFRVEVELSLVGFEQSRDAVNRLPGGSDALETARRLYAQASQLYIETATVYEVALDAPDGEVRTQLDLLARRLRLLGDRIFDRGRDVLGLDVQPGPDVEINLPAPVPDWRDEGLAAGPPLDDTGTYGARARRLVADAASTDRSVLTRLNLLIEADAARAAQVASLLPAGDAAERLFQLAARLAR